MLLFVFYKKHILEPLTQIRGEFQWSQFKCILELVMFKYDYFWYISIGMLAQKPDFLMWFSSN